MQEDEISQLPSENEPKQQSETSTSFFNFFCCCGNDESEQTHGQNFHDPSSQGTTAESCPLVKNAPKKANSHQRLYSYNDHYGEPYFIYKLDRLN